MLYRIKDTFPYQTLEEVFGTVIQEAAHMAARQERLLNVSRLPKLLADALEPVVEAPPARKRAADTGPI